MNKPFSTAFFGGGIITLFLLLVLQVFAGFGDWGDGISHNGSSNSFLEIGLSCAYFFISAYGLLVFKTKPMLSACAILAHTLLVITYTILCFSAKKTYPDGYVWRKDMLFATIVMAIYFVPWIAVWCRVLFRKKTNIDGSEKSQLADKWNYPFLK